MIAAQRMSQVAPARPRSFTRYCDRSLFANLGGPPEPADLYPRRRAWAASLVIDTARSVVDMHLGADDGPAYGVTALLPALIIYDTFVENPPPNWAAPAFDRRQRAIAEAGRAVIEAARDYYLIRTNADGEVRSTPREHIRAEEAALWTLRRALSAYDAARQHPAPGSAA